MTGRLLKILGVGVCLAVWIGNSYASPQSLEEVDIFRQRLKLMARAGAVKFVTVDHRYGVGLVASPLQASTINSFMSALDSSSYATRCFPLYAESTNRLTSDKRRSTSAAWVALGPAQNEVLVYCTRILQKILPSYEPGGSDDDKLIDAWAERKRQKIFQTQKIVEFEKHLRDLRTDVLAELKRTHLAGASLTLVQSSFNAALWDSSHRCLEGAGLPTSLSGFTDEHHGKFSDKPTS